MEKLTNNPSTTGTSLKGYLTGVTYNDLVKAFGEPSYPEPSGDDKVQKEWVLSWEGNIYTIYDWKTYDPDYTTTRLTRWNVGSKSGTDIYGFGDELERLLFSKSGRIAIFVGR
jgi:hypothetical protein